MEPTDNNSKIEEPKVPENNAQGQTETEENPKDKNWRLFRQQREEERKLMEQAKKEAEEERKKAEEEAAVQAEFKRITQEYDAKLSLGKGSYDDYDEVMSEFPHAMHNALVLGTVNLPNTHDVIYYLANHPVRANELENTAARNWKGFMKELNALSKSLLENKEAAAREPKIRSPITRNKSDSVGSNSIDRSWEDLAKDPSLRF